MRLLRAPQGSRAGPGALPAPLRRIASPAEPGSEAKPLLRRVADLLLGRGMTLGLAVGALLLGIATFFMLSDGSPFGPSNTGLIVGLALVNLAVLAVLGASLAGRLVRVWAERRRGSAGSRLHVRLVLLFGVVAVVPAILVAGFAAAFFNLGIQAWFSDRVRTALEASLSASRAYLEEHRNNIRADALAMANDLNRAQLYLPDNGLAFARLLATHAALRGLTESIVFEPTFGRVVAHAGLTTAYQLDPPSPEALAIARTGDVAVLPGELEGRVRALVGLDAPSGLVLMIGRPVDAAVIEHMERTEAAVTAYQTLDRNRSGLQITFVMIFAIAALLVLLAAVLVGLVIANQLARPISRLILAAERVRAGDLSTRVEEGAADDEVASLSRAFNRMTNQLAAQRSELMEAYRQIDDRRRFTETVLAGVSAGVIGLDAAGRINLPNRSASEKLGIDLEAAMGMKLPAVVPEFAVLLDLLDPDRPERERTAEIRIGPPSHRRTLLARISVEQESSADGGAPEVVGYIVTFDDITELLSAQRKAAWADVARRIAHEIKNPLTPIQLSAERLKRRYLKEIRSDPETFTACTDTIVRQVGDIGRMVDEFSAFARMPQPIIRPEDPAQVIREALVLQRDAHPDIAYATELPEPALVLPCDRRLLGQALTNLLQNAADAIATRVAAEAEAAAAVEAAAAAAPELAGEPADHPAGMPAGLPPGIIPAVMPTGLSTGLSTGLPEALPMGHPTSLPVGHITLRLRAEPDQVVIMVEDDGIGLPPGEERERLTEPYVTHKAKGTGLGLAIVKKIMEDHGGRLVLEDRGEGVDGAGGENAGGGARAALVLPWRAAPGILPDRPAAPPRPDAEEMRRAHGA